MTEWEKLQNGLIYNDFDDDLFQRRVAAKKLFRAYNRTEDEETALRQQIMSELFKSVGKDVWIEPDFHCEFGKNIVIEFDGRPAAVYDIYGRKIKGSDGGVNAKVAFNSLVYIVTDEPISVTGVSYDTKNKIANSGFEQTSASGDADGWTKREYGGTAELTDDSYEGEYAAIISNTDSGKSTYIFREVSIDTAGTYTFSAMVKNNGSSAVKVMLRVYDRDGDSSATEVFNVTSGEYTKIQKDFTINQSGFDSHAFIIGIPQGVGEVTVDNVELVYKND